MINERWKEIPEYEGLYEVSTCGRVRRVKSGNHTHAGRVLSPRNKSGYHLFTISKNSKPRTFKASRLVAASFLPNPENKATVNHRNGIKNDDRVGNLEWATVAENTQHAYDTDLAHGRKGEKHHNSKLTEPQVRTIKALLTRGYHWKDLGDMYSVSPMTIRDINYGRTWEWLFR